MQENQKVYFMYPQAEVLTIIFVKKEIVGLEVGEGKVLLMKKDFLRQPEDKAERDFVQADWICVLTTPINNLNIVNL